MVRQGSGLGRGKGEVATAPKHSRAWPREAVGILTVHVKWERPLGHLKFGHLNSKLLLDVFLAQLYGGKRTVAASRCFDLSSCLTKKLTLPELMQVLMSMSLNCSSLFATGLY